MKNDTASNLSNELTGSLRHNRWHIRYAYHVGIGQAMITSGRIDPRDEAGNIWPCYNSGVGREDELHYSVMGQSALQAMIGACGWDMVVGTAEWTAAR